MSFDALCICSYKTLSFVFFTFHVYLYTKYFNGFLFSIVFAVFKTNTRCSTVDSEKKTCV